VLDYPLGRTDPVAPFTVMGNVLGGAPGSDADGAPLMGMDERVHHLAARFPDVKVHLYGKAFRPGRKLGHVNVIGSDLGELRRRARLAAGWLGDGVWADGYDVHGEARGDGNGAAPRAANAVAATGGAR
jgi:5-(carboxyamino)imidazole ribonucleotide synthase